MKKPILSKATLLDPRFKRIHLPPMVLVQTQREIKAEMNTIETFPRQVESPNESNDVQDDLWNYHDSRVATQVPERIESHVLPSELRRFLEEPVVARSVNPLEYWEAVKSTYRTLYPIAIKYLSIPATTVPCERLFSKASLIDTKRRNRLLPIRVSQLLFLSGLTTEQWELDKDNKCV